MTDLQKNECLFCSVAFSPKSQYLRKEFEDNYDLSETSVSRYNLLVEKLLEIYANTHGIRYVPDDPVAAHYKLNISKVLKSIIKKNQLADQW
jgi:hypothetical protein